MIIVSLRADDFDSNGFVFVGGIVEAILDATEKKNVVKTKTFRYHPCLIDPDDSLPSNVQAGTIVEDIIERHSILSERKIFSEINRAIVAGDLTVFGRNGIGRCAKEDIPLGIVTFPELAAWGQKVGIYQFRRADADSGSKGDAIKVGAGGTEVEKPDIPGKMPRVAIGRLAVTAAWEIECETNRAATADKVIERLQVWATGGEHPDILLRAEPRKRAVIWMTKKTGLEKDYDVGACGKTLDEWRKSRA